MRRSTHIWPVLLAILSFCLVMLLGARLAHGDLHTCIGGSSSAANWQACVGSPLPAQSLQSLLSEFGIPNSVVPEPNVTLAVLGLLVALRARQSLRSVVRRGR